MYYNFCNQRGIAVAHPSTWRLVSRKRIWAEAQAYCIWLLEMLFTQHKKDVDTTIATMKPHSPQWYTQTLAKNFQYGYNLIPGTDKYDNTGIPEDVVAASKIIAFAAMVEEPFLRLKVAKLQGANLAPLSDPELTAFWNYIKKTKDAGVKLYQNTVTSGVPDQLRLVLRVIVNPLVLNLQGQRINTTDLTPVQNAIRKYLQNIDFNGEFSTQDLEDAIRAVDGVDDLSTDEVQMKYGALPFTSVDINRIPDSGYLVIDDSNLIITFSN
jgi:hypothetical protein